MPFHFSTSVVLCGSKGLALAEKPTAHTLGPRESTAVRELLGCAPSGVATIVQTAPFQFSASVCRAVPSNELPTAHRLLAETAVTAPSTVSSFSTFSLAGWFHVWQKCGEYP